MRTSELVDLEPLLTASSGPLWTRLRRLPDGLRTARLGEALVLLRHADGRAALGNRAFGQGILEDLGSGLDPRYVARRRRSLLHLSGAEHARMRRLASPAFKPGAIDRMRPLMRRTFGELVDRTIPGPVVDAVAAWTHPYPIPVICSALGIPAADLPLYSRTADAWTLALFDASAVPEGLAAHDELDAHVRRLVEARRAEPADDLITDLIQQQEDLTTEDLTALVSALIMAGTDTTRLQLASCLEFLAGRPDLWAELKKDPGLIPAAVEEMARLTPVASFLRRVATADATVNGLDIPAGTRIILAIPAMNRDPDVYADPHAYDLGRPAAAATLSFGGGAHYCLGGQLGRVEMQEALGTLLGRVARLEPAGPPTWRPLRSLQGPARLPIRYEPERGSNRA
ncbi:cytochrome P450 [Nonomuraea sp. SMC257]|uniref:Cytochrome P450 n=1 Tax=Nonomuraea montanisoli TaxID=2741721 RepID=A0A7Y6IDQ6_9ACTN|nr:cytochrome P450 [Nonomuraea montanisoli]NUW36373.1 cytochrome P450 [Nonomuraea montanisoli]